MGAPGERPPGARRTRPERRESPLSLGSTAGGAGRTGANGAVRRWYEAAMGNGGTDNGPPGLRPHYGPDYFAAFVIDPEGNNIEAVCHVPE